MVEHGSHQITFKLNHRIWSKKQNHRIVNPLAIAYNYRQCIAYMGFAIYSLIATHQRHFIRGITYDISVSHIFLITGIVFLTAITYNVWALQLFSSITTHRRHFIKHAMGITSPWFIKRNPHYNHIFYTSILWINSSIISENTIGEQT